MRSETEIKLAITLTQQRIAEADTIECPSEQAAAYAQLPKERATVEAFQWALEESVPPIVLPAGKEHYPPLISSRETQVVVVLTKDNAAAFSAYAHSSLRVIVVSEVPSWPMDATKEELEEPATHVRFVLWAKHADDIFWLAYHFNWQPAPASDEVLAELKDMTKSADWALQVGIELLGQQNAPMAVEVLQNLKANLPALLARVRQAEAFKTKAVSQIEVRIGELKKQREEYQDKRSEMSHNPDNEEEHEALYVSIRQCDFAIEELESVLGTDEKQ